MNQTPATIRLTEALCLAATLAVLGYWLVPTHIVSIWMDPEFTGWVVPISNRFSDGIALYGDGGHSPMPPLPFLVTYIVSFGDGIWLTESVLNFVFQALTLITTYLALANRLPGRIAFWATLAAIPVFFALTKSIFYDSMTQFLVAAGIYTMLRLSDALDEYAGQITASKVAPWSFMVWPALILAAALFTKHSTAAGMVLGAAAFLLLRPTLDSVAQRAIHLVQLGAASLGFALALLLLIAVLPMFSAGGMLGDVYLAGAETKGGAGVLLGYGAAYLGDIATALWPGGVIAAVLFVLAAKPVRSEAGGNQLLVCAACVAGAGIIVVLAAAFLAGLRPPQTLMAYLQYYSWSDVGKQTVNSFVLWAGFFTLLLAALRSLLPARSGLNPAAATLAGLFWLAVPPAVFHSLSVADFRWAYDNNPLIIAAIAAVLWVTGAGLARISGKLAQRQAVVIGATGLLVTLVTTALLPQKLFFVAQATETWDEVAYLDGATLRRDADGLRQLVNKVRDLAPDAGNDEVLLLPEDPNVQAWFDRPRPALTSAITFIDQYRDQYVEEDLQRLLQSPPKVIVIGPLDYYQRFNSIYSKQGERGTDALIRRIQSELLNEYYENPLAMEITMRFQTQTMKVYVRK